MPLNLITTEQANELKQRVLNFQQENWIIPGRLVEILKISKTTYYKVINGVPVSINVYYNILNVITK